MPLAATHLWIDTRDQLDAFISALPAHATLAVDTEFMRRDTFYPQLALLQVAGGGQTALIDPLAIDLGAPLRSVLADAATCCIMHSASEDMEALSALIPHGPGQLFDTQIAAALAGMGPGLSYQKLVAELTGDELDKGETRSDWTQRPLSASQRAYAALDVLHLHDLHDQLQARLDALGRLEWLHEDCMRLTRRAVRDVLDPQPQRKLAAAAHWPRPQQALLRRLLLWREHTARRLDKPRPWLFNDKQLLDLVAHPPATLDALRERLRGQRALRHTQAQDLFDTMQQPLTDEELATTQAIPAPIEREQRGAIKDLKQQISACAEKLALPPGLLCPRRLLEEALIEHHWPDELQGWRKPLLEPILAAALNP